MRAVEKELHEAVLRLHPERVMPEDIDAVLVDCDGATDKQVEDYIAWLYVVSVALRQHYRVAKYSRWSPTAEDFLNASDRAEKHKNDIIKRKKAGAYREQPCYADRGSET